MALTTGLQKQQRAGPSLLPALALPHVRGGRGKSTLASRLCSLCRPVFSPATHPEGSGPLLGPQGQRPQLLVYPLSQAHNEACVLKSRRQRVQAATDLSVNSQGERGGESGKNSHRARCSGKSFQRWSCWSGPYTPGQAEESSCLLSVPNHHSRSLHSMGCSGHCGLCVYTGVSVVTLPL